MLALYATWFSIEQILAANTTITQLNAIHFSSAWFLVSEIDFWRRGFERWIWPDCSYRDSGCPRSKRVCSAKIYNQEMSFWRNFCTGCVSKHYGLDFLVVVMYYGGLSFVFWGVRWWINLQGAIYLPMGCDTFFTSERWIGFLVNFTLVKFMRVTWTGSFEWGLEKWV